MESLNCNIGSGQINQITLSRYVTDTLTDMSGPHTLYSATPRRIVRRVNAVLLGLPGCWKLCILYIDECVRAWRKYCKICNVPNCKWVDLWLFVEHVFFSGSVFLFRFFPHFILLFEAVHASWARRWAPFLVCEIRLCLCGHNFFLAFALL